MLVKLHMVKLRRAIFCHGWCLPLLLSCLEARVCTTDSFGSSEADEADGTFSLLQVATTARRAAPVEVGHPQDSILEAEQSSTVLADKVSIRNKFPTPTSPPSAVETFLRRCGFTRTARLMKQDHITGDAFIRMGHSDLVYYGMSDDQIKNILPRLQTARAQPNLRKRMLRMAKNEAVFQKRSSLHDIVGDDGVLMISLGSASDRFNHSSHALKQVGIHVNKLSAVDASTATPQELAQGCLKSTWRKAEKWCLNRAGQGCLGDTAQAIALSHKKALEWAKKRDGEWTAVFEDDAVPAPLENWELVFRDAWAKLPKTVKFVRLGWCYWEHDDWTYPVFEVPFAESNISILVESWKSHGETRYDPGGCTTAYMVHKDILDEVLNLFPCCGPVDSCYKWDFFKRVDPDTNKFHGLHAMLSLDSHSEPLWDDWYLEHHGLFFQDRGKLDRTQVLHR
mmetsp:Transcript_8960/g.15429  ORF Transcript_8960/g.15429 Transcript_8960/m.15429 type:complete len:452 (+) Transcript_8960:35-1390(+)